MQSKDKYLNPHSIFGKQTFEQYCRRILSFHFRDGVPEDVIKNFEVIESMLALSYYEYRLIDEAYAKSLHTFEMAMLLRFDYQNPNFTLDLFPNFRNES